MHDSLQSNVQHKHQNQPETIEPCILVQENDFDIAHLYGSLAAASQSTGAIAIFTGLVRDLNLEKNVQDLYLEHYPGMTENVLSVIAKDAIARFELHAITVIHRVGHLKPGDNIVFVGCGTMHREDAFKACQFVMDRLKTEAPFWKKEGAQNGSTWLSTQEKDLRLSQRWETSNSSK